ncbi:MAG TPA: hypothetical protein VJZ72_12140 [Candidatus Limnocylindrales bacterium]|nr:hypothetical protein [Candidatus Limnocylindrales bacterium]
MDGEGETMRIRPLDERIERALRQGPPDEPRYVAAPLPLAFEPGSARPRARVRVGAGAALHDLPNARLVWIVALLGLLAAAVVGVALVGSRPSVGPLANGKIAFADVRGDIWIVDPDGSDLTRLTDASEPEWGPVWSPGGRQIAFVRELQPGGPAPEGSTPEEKELGTPSVTEIFVMNAGDTELAQLTSSSGGVIWSVIWSPDGTRIAFAQEAAGGVLAIDVENPVPVLLFEHPGASVAGWSPDGGRLLIETTSVGSVEPTGVFVIDVATRHQTLVVEPPGLAGLDWSPDASRITGWSDPDGSARSTQIEVVNADGSGRRTLAENGVWPTWSPDGGRILYTFTHGEPDGTKNEIWVMAADGSGPRKLADGFLSRGWSPDGEKILFSGHDDATYLMNRDGSGVAKLLDQPISGSQGFDWQAIRP